VLPGRGLCDDLIAHPEDSYRLWCVVVCDIETSWMRSTEGCSAKNKQITFEARGGAVGWGTELQAGRSRVRFPLVSLEFFKDIILPAAFCNPQGLSRPAMGLLYRLLNVWFIKICYF